MWRSFLFSPILERDLDTAAWMGDYLLWGPLSIT
jgi:hypothetical protein